jgi:hypothetical protein
MAAVVVAFEIGRRSLAAQIAVDTLVIDIEFASYVFRVLVCGISHDFSRKSEVESQGETLPAQLIWPLRPLRATATCRWHVKALKS